MNTVVALGNHTGNVADVDDAGVDDADRILFAQVQVKSRSMKIYN